MVLKMLATFPSVPVWFLILSISIFLLPTFSFGFSQKLVMGRISLFGQSILKPFSYQASR
jgi:hypothetical protein